MSFQLCLCWDCLASVLTHGESDIVQAGVSKHIPIPEMEPVQSFADHHTNVTCDGQEEVIIALWKGKFTEEKNSSDRQCTNQHAQ